ncbi:MAG: hypothetical protein EOP83_22375 [Verrucomicrobiaceae bacterium]|nr:MAG: hypothetical protein EOP83_22375 [Verrucomicrobiaceae bacterium]
MNRILTSMKYLTALAFVALAAGCATELENKEDLAVAAGFRVITPRGADQQTILTQLPPTKVTPVTYKGKQYYVLPDAKNNRAYVGGPKQYQSYQQLRIQRQISNDNLMAAQMNEDAAMSVGMWGGWDNGWGPGWY